MAWLCPEPALNMWQATWWRSGESGVANSGGSTEPQTSCAKLQRVRKRQPDGGLSGLGGSPVSGISRVRFAGSKLGFDFKSARV